MIKYILIFLLFATPCYGAFETLYVDSTDDTKNNWTTRVNTPYLDDSDASYIHEDKSAAATEGDFGFANTANSAGNQVDGVDLYFKCYGDDTDDGFTVYIDVGAGFVNAGNITINQTGAYDWEVLNVDVIVDTFTKVDAIKMYLYRINGGGGDDTYVNRAYMYVEYSEAAAGRTRRVSAVN